MCGIVGAINGNSVVAQLMTGLERLEYRGYDSAGLAALQAGRIMTRRAEGKILCLQNALEEAPLDGRVGIAHTRWATHGGPSVRNAHPHVTDRVAVVHNGIIENYRDLRAELEALGHHFSSDTDTEVVPRLIGEYLSVGDDPEEATFKTLDRLEGAYSLGILFAGEEDRMIAARRGSPLVVGLGDGANYIASDGAALAGMANATMHLEDGDWAVIGNDAVEIRNRQGASVTRAQQSIKKRTSHPSKGSYRHYMKKEIHEQPDVIRETLRAYLNPESSEVDLPVLPFEFAAISKLNIVACGTSFHAGLIAKYWLEEFADLPTEVDIASEFRYRNPPLAKSGVSLFISQSGETADSLSALRHAKSKGQYVIALVNSPDSTIAREADVVLHTRAGPEIGVASTKAFTTQLAVLACLTISAGRARCSLNQQTLRRLVCALTQAPNAIEALVEDDANYKKIAKQLVSASSTLFVGRGTAFPAAVEGALKLKEISYIHAEGYSAGELKHGPIALIDDDMPVIVLAPPDALFDKTVSNLQEIAARGARVIMLSSREGLDTVGDAASFGLTIPDCDPFIAPILYSVPLQMVAYHVAFMKGTDIDQPRNLAKSVTVE